MKRKNHAGVISSASAGALREVWTSRETLEKQSVCYVKATCGYDDRNERHLIKKEGSTAPAHLPPKGMGFGFVRRTTCAQFNARTDVCAIVKLYLYSRHFRHFRPLVPSNPFRPIHPEAWWRQSFGRPGTDSNA